MESRFGRYEAAKMAFYNAVDKAVEEFNKTVANLDDEGRIPGHTLLKMGVYSERLLKMYLDYKDSEGA